MSNLTELSHKEKTILAEGYAKQAEQDPVVFIDRFLYTFNPKQEPYHFPFKLFPFQKDLVYEIKAQVEKGEDIFIEKCREMGATYTVLDVFLWFWRYIPGSNFLLGSRKEQFVDNRGGIGKNDDQSNKEESLFGKLEYTLDRCPPIVLPKGYDRRQHFTYMSLKNPENGNVISGESSNRNFSRGGRYKAVLLDEFAFWENDTEAWGSTADTTGCRIVLTTPGIKPSKAKRLRFGIDGEKIKVTTLPYHLDPRKTQAWLAKEMERRSPDDFAREIMINWEKAIGGVVYQKEFKEELHFKYFDHEVNQHGDYYLGHDFAVRGWTAAVLGWVRPDGILYILDEYKEEGSTVKVHGEAIKQMVKKHVDFKKLMVDYGDPSGFSDTQQGLKDGKETVWALSDEYLEDGFPLVKGNNAVTAGINFVRQQFLSNKLMIHPRCKELKAEIDAYRWKDLPDSRKEDVDEPEVIRKINDHLVDALRYLSYSKPIIPEEEEVPSKKALSIKFPPPVIEKKEEDADEITEIDVSSPYD